MVSADVVIAGGGVAGLLLASALGPKCSVILLEHHDAIPRNKYWLTDISAVQKNPELRSCVDREYEFMDFVAYDGTVATVNGNYCLWDTDRLLSRLEEDMKSAGVTVLTGHTLYSYSQKGDAIIVRANSKEIKAKLLIDCMGFGSPIVGAKGIAKIKGYYVLHGCEVNVTGDVRPIGLDNVLINEQPTFFELFPTSKETAHAAIILPSRVYRPNRSLRTELMFILQKSHYSQQICGVDSPNRQSYFGIVPVGQLRTPALDHILFFGEAGQVNPAASATGLTRMLLVYKELANGIESSLARNALSRRDLLRSIPDYMSRMNRVFQEILFESLLRFDSDDFRSLVVELRDYPDEIVNDLIFAKFSFRPIKSLRLAGDAILKPRGVLGKHLMKSFSRFIKS
jgi:flavin-dependent dehydrogenase